MKKNNKILIFIIAILSLFVLVGCNETIPNENCVTLYLDDAYAQKIDYDDIPSFKFEFNGVLNTIETVKKPYYTVFSNNNDDILSDAMTELFEQYKDRMYVSVDKINKTDERKYSKLDENGKLYNINMKVDDSNVYDEVAYIDLENGLKLTIDYSRFVSDGKTYYTWRYSASITFYLYYPLMVIENDNDKELVLITIPNVIGYKVTPEQKLSSLLSKKAYLDSSMYTFNYFESDEINTLELKKEYVRSYYDDYNYEKIDDNSFTFEYLNNKFKVVMNDGSFTITWLSRK